MQLVRPTLSNCARNYTQSVNPGLWQGLVGAWVPALGMQGGMLVDASGRGNSGVLTSMDPQADWVMDQRGYALDFDGSNDRVAIPSASFTLNDLTICGWINGLYAVGSGNLQTIFCGNDFVTSLAFGSTTSRNIFLYLGGTSLGSPANKLNVGQWHFVAGRRVGSVTTVHIDGKVQNTGTKIGEISVPAPCGIGDRPATGRPFDGKIASLYLFARGLDDSELMKLAADPLAPWRLRDRRVGGLFTGSVPASTFKSFYSPRKYRWGIQ